MADIARYAGLSLATVSKYINGGKVKEKNQKKIEDAITALDYKANEIARSLRTRKSKSIGILLPTLDSVFFSNVVANIENHLAKYGYGSIVCFYQNDKEMEKDKLDFLLRRQIDGLILVPQHLKKEDMQRVNIPVVMIDRSIKNMDCDRVIINNKKACYDSVEQLIKLNHKRIAVLCDCVSKLTSLERLSGYMEALRQHSIDVENNLIKIAEKSATFDTGYQMVKELFSLSDKPTAILATNYELTVGSFLALLKKRIKIPEDISFIGFDHLDILTIEELSFSVVAQPVETIGEQAAMILLKRIDNDLEDFPKTLILDAEIIFRDSMKMLT